MPFVIVVVSLAALLPFGFLLISGVPVRGAFSRWGPGYDNDSPRESLSKLTGWRQRAHFAQQNGHEAFAPFAAAVFLAHWAHAPQAWLVGLACTFLVARVGHGVAYVAGAGGWRSAFWWAGFGCVLGLFAVAFASAGGTLQS